MTNPMQYAKPHVPPPMTEQTGKEILKALDRIEERLGRGEERIANLLTAVEQAVLDVND